MPESPLAAAAKPMRLATEVIETTFGKGGAAVPRWQPALRAWPLDRALLADVADQQCGRVRTFLR
jgi:hypothetical protein